MGAKSWVFLLILCSVCVASQEGRYTHISDFGLVECIGLIILFLGMAIGSAAGIGGGGIIMPILLIVYAFNIQESSALSNFMIFLGFVMRFAITYKEKHPKKNRPVIDYETASLMIPASLVGTKLGVILHGILPEPFLLIFLTVTLVYLSYKSYLQGWKARIAVYQQVRPEPSPSPSVKQESAKGSHEIELLEQHEREADEVTKQRIAEIAAEYARPIPIKQSLFLLGLIGCLLVSMLVEGGKGLPSLLGIQKCSGMYWTSMCCFMGLCVFATWVLGRDVLQLTTEKQLLNWPFAPDDVRWSWGKIAEYSAYGIMAGILSSMFGIGGGIVLTPMLAQLGLLPVVVSSTGGLFVLLTTAASSALLMSQGYLTLSYGLLMGAISLLSGIASAWFIASLVKKSDKSYVIIFLLAAIVLFSGVSITAVGLHREYEAYGTLFSAELWQLRNYCH